MPTCIVCLNTLKDPAALPCGHVFCYDCLIRLIRSITPYTSNHFCPTCKQQYTISNVEPWLVPHHLRPYITPSVRKLHLEYTIPVPDTLSPSSSNTKYETLLAENASLKTCCFVWRKRATVHAAATLGLVGLARLARDYGLRMKTERDELEKKYNELKNRYDERLLAPVTPPETPPLDTPMSPRNEQLRANSLRLPHLPHISELDLSPMEANLPPSLMRSSRKGSRSPSRGRRSVSPCRMPSPAASEDSYCSDCPDCTDRKRKRESPEAELEGEHELERPIKRSHSTSPDILISTPLSPDILTSTPLSPERAIANYLEGSLTI